MWVVFFLCFVFLKETSIIRSHYFGCFWLWKKKKIHIWAEAGFFVICRKKFTVKKNNVSVKWCGKLITFCNRTIWVLRILRPHDLWWSHRYQRVAASCQWLQELSMLNYKEPPLDLNENYFVRFLLKWRRRWTWNLKSQQLDLLPNSFKKPLIRSLKKPLLDKMASVEDVSKVMVDRWLIHRLFFFITGLSC